MNAATEFDLGPLTWVKGEIDLALERANEALRQSSGGADPTQFKFCRTHVHQVHGALAIVGLDGLTQITESLEALLLVLEEGKVPVTPEALGSIEKAMAAIRQYLDDLMAGEPNQPLRLLPAYEALAAARGIERVRATDLFYPDLSLRPPKRPSPGKRLSPEELRVLLKTERVRFQKGLLAWLKKPDAAAAGLEQMRTALANIEASQESPAARAFWWVSLGFLEALADRGIASEVETRQLCARIDLQIRRLLEGSRNVAERLMRDALYYVAKAPEDHGGTLHEVRSAFQLDELLPSSVDAASAAEPHELLLRRLREAILATEELWNKFCAGSTGMLAGFAEQARNCANLTAEIGQTDLKRLGQGVGAIAAWLLEQPSRHAEAVAMEVATAILLLHNAQENFKRLGTDFAQQVDLMVARLHSCIAGKPAGGEDAVPLLDEMTRRAQEKLLIGQVAREIQNNLLQIEQALDAFFRAPEGAHELTQLEGPLKQIAGALTILGHDSALDSLRQCSEQIKRFAAPDYVAANEDFEAVAQQLSMIGFFVDSLQHGSADFDTFARKLKGEPEEVPDEIEEAADILLPSTVETELEQQKKETQALVEALREKPADAQLKDELKQNLQALQKDADLVADHQLGETAKAALSALEAGEIATPDLDAALASLKPATLEAPLPSAETLQLAQSSHEEIDAELLAIFLEEAHEVLGTMAENLELLSAEPHNIEALTTIRRSTHTLKGSGRMVGLRDLGETAWALEQTLNVWLRQELEISAEFLAMIRQEHALFTDWIAHLENQAPAAPDPTALIALAERLRGAEATAIPAAEATAPAAAATTTAQIIELPVAKTSRPAPSEVVELIESEGFASDTETIEFDLSDIAAPAEEATPAEQTEEPISFDIGDLTAGAEPETLELMDENEAPDLVETLLVPIGSELAATEASDAAAGSEPVLTEEIASDAGFLDFDLGDLSTPATDAAEVNAAEESISFDIGDLAEPAAPETVPPTVDNEAPDLAETLLVPIGSDLAAAEASAADEAPEPVAIEPMAADTGAFEFDLGDLSAPAEHTAEVNAAEESISFDIGDLTEPSEPEAVPPTADSAASDLTETLLVPIGSDLADAEPSKAGEASEPLATEPIAADTDSFDFDLGDLSAPAEATAEAAPADESISFDIDDLSEPPGAGPVEEIETLASPETATAQAIEATEPDEAEARPIEAEPSPPPAPTLYDIFREEARGHLNTLSASYSELELAPAGPTTFAMTRAAHTLGGIAATVGLLPINKVAIALEHALLRRDASSRPDSIEGLETVRQAIICLEDMFAALQEQRAPEPAPAMVEALEEIYPLPAPTPEVLAAPAATLTADGETAEPAATAPPAEALAAPAPKRELPRLQDELDEQLLPIFLEEAQDLVRGFGEQLRHWRGNPEEGAAPQALSRLLHTFKGSARMAGAMNLGELTHNLETRVEEILRAGTPSLPQIEEIESGCDTLEQIVERLQAGETTFEPPPLAPVAIETPQAPGAVAAKPAPTVVHEAPAAVHDGETEANAQRATLRVRADLLDRLVNEAGELSIARARIEGEMRGLKNSLLELTENVIRLRRQLREIEIQAETQMQAHVAQSHETHADFDPLELDRFTRFQELTRFMAESVNDVATVQQNLLKNLDEANAAILAQARLNRSLQQDLMGVRMVPFASQSERLYRIVRQTAKEVGKRANLDIRGGQVEIDRSVLDKMLAPLEHMLRNAISHGIENRETRMAQGKPEIGEVTLALQQEGNEIIVSLADDGRGLDAARIRAHAEKIGMLAPGAAVDDARLFEFIFQPGFSTASEVTQIAGRGVGMDVVKTEVASLGGRIETVSTPGQGTTFRLYLPLTLAVTQTLLVRAGTQTYAIPSTMIEQVQELKEKNLNAIREKGEAEWMGHRYPLYFLPHLLGDAGALPETRRQYWVLLLRSGAQRVAIQVDELQGNQEVVVKNIGPQLARVVGIAGATVLGDGHVVLILNPVALASRAPSVSAPQPIPEAVTAALPAATATLPTVMVVDDSLTVRKITSRLLAREGYQVVAAKDGVDALEQLLEIKPDVVLSDIEMPRMDGFDLVRNIRGDDRLKDLPVIMITSRTAEKHRNYAIEIGANHYLGKPYDEDELLRLIAGYVKTKRVS